MTAAAAGLTAISSMATRDVLAELAAMYRRSGADIALEAVAGVEAARRIRTGEAFDVAILADEAMASLESEGRVVRGSRVAVAASEVAVAVREGVALPDIGSEAGVRDAVLAASRIGYSTGPSGTYLMRLFEGWGIAESIRSRIVQAPPGVPVGKLVASGEVDIGFQQLSELVHLPGIRVVGTLPAPIRITTIFSGGLCATSIQPSAARAWLSFIATQGEDVKRRHGMEP
jgi:molybdate transport system substrate-binding protein